MGLPKKKTEFAYSDTLILVKASSFIKEVLTFAEKDEEGGYAEAASIEAAVKFARLIEHNRLKLPTLDLFLTNEIAFVWRHKTRGILTILFDKHGKTHFSCYFASTKVVRKGNIVEENVIPNDIKAYIKAISEGV